MEGENVLIDEVDEVLDTLKVAEDSADGLLERRRKELANSVATTLNTDVYDEKEKK